MRIALTRVLLVACLLASTHSIPAAEATVLENDTPDWAAPAEVLLFSNTASSLFNGLLVLRGRGGEFFGVVGVASGVAAGMISLLAVGEGLSQSNGTGHVHAAAALAATGAVSFALGWLSLRNAKHLPTDSRYERLSIVPGSGTGALPGLAVRFGF